MELRICKDRYELGKSAAKLTAQLINEAIKEKGNARTLGGYIVDEVTQSFKETGMLNRICHVKFAY